MDSTAHFKTLAVVAIVLAATTVPSLAAGKAWHEHVIFGRPSSHLLVTNAGYVVGYDYKKLCPAWVSYRLVPEYCSGKTALTNPPRFFPDPQVMTAGVPYARDKDYSRTDYARAQMFPPADALGRGADCERESYSLANVLPQHAKRSRKGWTMLEDQVRIWAREYGELWVISGPIDINPSNTIGSGVSIPEYCYKIVVRTNSGSVEATAFIIPQGVDIKNLGSYFYSIDQVERHTRLNFLHALPDEVEKELESTKWIWPLGEKGVSSRFEQVGRHETRLIVGLTVYVIHPNKRDIEAFCKKQHVSAGGKLLRIHFYDDRKNTPNVSGKYEFPESSEPYLVADYFFNASKNKHALALHKTIPDEPEKPRAAPPRVKKTSPK